jgi:N-acetylneuraminic acid mutarotase
VGGWDEAGDAVRSLEIYDPTTNRWVWGRSMPTASQLPGVAWSGDRLYAIGGLDNNNDPLSNVEAYDPATNTWQERAPMPTPRGHPAVATLNNGQIIVAGGGPPSGTAAVELYTPSSNKWQKLTSLPVRADPTGALAGHMFYVISGFALGQSVTRAVWAAVVQ